jgi:hypothetical protein
LPGRLLGQENGVMNLSGVPALNKLELAAHIKANGNSVNGQLATRYLTAVNTLIEEYANLANGGYAPTEPAWNLANEQVNGNYGVKQLGASLDEIQRLIRYRVSAVPGLSTMGAGRPIDILASKRRSACIMKTSIRDQMVSLAEWEAAD